MAIDAELHNLSVKTGIPIDGLKKMMEEDPESFQKIQYLVEGEGLIDSLQREAGNKVAQDSAWNTIIASINGIFDTAQRQVIDYQYNKLGSRYTMASLSQKDQNAKAIQDEKDRRMRQIALVGVIGLGAFILFMR